MSNKKNIFINSTEMVSFGEYESIPTCIRYSGNDRPSIGFEAQDIFSGQDTINEDFKIDLGKIKPGQSPATRELFQCGDGKSRSAYNISADFFKDLIHVTKKHLHQHNLSIAKHLLISEPLSFMANDDSDWLEKYRGNLRRIFDEYFETIEFLPEPFAVYQYYRYGFKHSLVAQDRKHCALVIDFGGGTFDASIVETSQTGDISKKGKHSRPLGAKSVPCGGFEINRILARKLVLDKYSGSLDKEKLKKGIENYFRWREKLLDIDSLNLQNRQFVFWFGSFLRQIESVKIDLVGKIKIWDLDATLNVVAKIDIPVYVVKTFWTGMCPI